MKQRAKTSLVWLLALSLLISVSASVIALASRIRYYTVVEDVNSMIPLVPEGVTEDELRAAAEAARKSRYTAAPMAARMTSGARAVPLTHSTVPAVRALRPQNTAVFTVSDDRTVWGTSTEVDIFRTSYENGAHTVTVASGRGDKVIAPGTENAYTFKLKNSLTVPVDYTVTVNAWFTPDDVQIPVTCRLSRYDGHWVAGNDTTWLDVPAFDGAEDAAVLSSNSYVTYTLDWQWPFDGNDALDSALGQRANEEDLTLTIEIVTSATAIFDEPDDPDDPDTPDEPVDPDVPLEPSNPDKPEVGEDLPPKTGDDSDPGLWMVLAAASFMLLVVLLLWQDKDKDKKPARPKGD